MVIQSLALFAKSFSLLLEIVSLLDGQFEGRLESKWNCQSHALWPQKLFSQF